MRTITFIILFFVLLNFFSLVSYIDRTTQVVERFDSSLQSDIRLEELEARQDVTIGRSGASFVVYYKHSSDLEVLLKILGINIFGILLSILVIKEDKKLENLDS